MSQQINLYSPIFRRQKKYFSASTMAISLGIVVLGVSALCAYARIQVGNLARQATQTSGNLNAEVASLQALTSDKTGETRQKTLDAQIADTEARLAERQRLAEALKSEILGNPQGFSQQLMAFSRQRIDGLWLTEISIDAETDVLGIAGRTIRADLVPSFIAQLRKEKSLRGRSFENLEIAWVKPVPGTSSSTGPSQRETFEFRLHAGDGRGK